jgi:hypothetical protein
MAKAGCQKQKRPAERSVLKFLLSLITIRLRGRGQTLGETALFAGRRVFVDDAFGSSTVDYANRHIFGASEGFFDFSFDTRLGGGITKALLFVLTQTFLGGC